MNNSFFEQFQDNTFGIKRIKDNGYFKFAKTCFPRRFEFSFDEVHFDMLKLILKLNDPLRHYIMERQAYMLVHREAAKSTIGNFLSPMFDIYMKGKPLWTTPQMLDWTPEQIEENRHLMLGSKVVEIPRIKEDFIVIAAQTLRNAERWVMDLKSTIEERNDLAQIFGERDPRVLNEYEEQSKGARKKSNKIWRVNSFITKADKRIVDENGVCIDNGTVIWGIGAGQNPRGLNVGGQRPTKIVMDDIYSQENVISEESRNKITSWVFDDLINSVDTKRGKAICLGTLLHPQTVFEHFENSEMWFGIKRPIIGLRELDELVKAHTDDYGVMTIPTSKDCLKIDDELKTLSWRDSKGSFFILCKYKDYAFMNKLQAFYQEFMNEPFDPKALNAKRTDFHETPIEYYEKQGRPFVRFEFQDMRWSGRVNLYCGVDTASSQSKTSDDTAIVVAGLARCYPVMTGIDIYSSAATEPHGRIFPIILHIEGGKYAIHENLPFKGISNNLLALDKMYKLNSINIESNAGGEIIYREVYDDFQRAHRDTTVWHEFSSERKQDRILNTILPPIQKYKNYICNPNSLITKLYSQILTIGTSHDDYPDALAIALKFIDMPEENADYEKSLPGYKKTKDRWDHLVEKFGIENAWYYC